MRTEFSVRIAIGNTAQSTPVGFAVLPIFYFQQFFKKC